MRRIVSYLLRPRLVAFGRDRRGVTAVTVAIMLPVIIGFAALGVSVGVWLDAKRDLQTQADAGALAGKSQVLGGSSGNGTAAVAARNGAITSAVTSNGYSGVTCPTGTVCVVNYPHTGPLGDTQAVQVRLQKQQPLFFASIYTGLQVTVGAQATAEARKIGDACIIALDPDSTGDGVLFTGNSRFDAEKCIVAANQVNATSVAAGGNTRVRLESIYSAGGYNESGSADMTYDSVPLTGQPQLTDPLLTVESADTTLANIHTNGFAGCTPSSSINASGTYNPGTYCQIKIQTGMTVTLNPGTYYIYQGDLDVAASATLTANNATIILTTRSSQPGSVGTVKINGTATVTMTPPTSGMYQGVSLYYDRIAPTKSGSSAALQMNGSSTMSITGVIYAPNQKIEFSGNNGATAPTCTRLIGLRITFTGTNDTALDTSGCAALLPSWADTSIYAVKLTE